MVYLQIGDLMLQAANNLAALLPAKSSILGLVLVLVVILISPFEGRGIGL